MTDDRRLALRERTAASSLQMARVDDDRLGPLSSERRCLEILQMGDTEWDVLMALCVHIGLVQGEHEPSGIDWSDEAYGPVLQAVWDTAGTPLALPDDDPYQTIPFDPQISRYFHARVAAGLVMRVEEPTMALRYLEEAYELLPPQTQCRLSADIERYGARRVRPLLQRLYEGFEDYERALDMMRMSGMWSTYIERYALAEAYLARWTLQLTESAPVSTVRRLLDTVHSFILNADQVDDEFRESLADCPRDTREFWAWFYGKLVGWFHINHPHLNHALRHELTGSDWVQGWPAVALLAEPTGNWSDQRETCMFLYEAADLEYKGSRPWNSRQPAHLSPESDLYWAMRVGYCDAHIEAVHDADGTTLEAISAQLDDVRQIASASALRTMRFEEEANHRLSGLRDAIPTVDTAKDAIADAVGKEMLNVFPVSAVEHLVEAWLASRQGRPDDARVATIKAIETVFKRLVRDKLTERSPDLKIPLPGRKGPRRYQTLERIEHWQLSVWANILSRLASAQEGDNAELAAALKLAFPDVDFGALGRCANALYQSWKLRGAAAHDSVVESYDEARDNARQLWAIAVGTQASPGLISRLCTALGAGPTGMRSQDC